MLRVFETGRPDMLALVPYTIERETPDGRHVEERYWSATHTPVFDASGQVHAVLQHTTDVTDVQRTRAELEAVRQAQGATPEQLWQGVVSRARAVQDANSALEAQRTPPDVVVRAGAGLHGGDLRPRLHLRDREPRVRGTRRPSRPHRPQAGRGAARDHRTELPATARPGARDAAALRRARHGSQTGLERRRAASALRRFRVPADHRRRRAGRRDLRAGP